MTHGLAASGEPPRPEAELFHSTGAPTSKTNAIVVYLQDFTATAEQHSHKSL